MTASTRPMAYPQNDPVTARRALAHALTGYLDRRRVREAVALWSQHFEGRGSLFVGLSRYCKQIAEAFGLPGKEAELHLKIFRALQLDTRQLPADPLSLPAEEAVVLPAAPIDPGAGPGAFVMQRFHAALDTQLARDLPPGVTPALWRRTLIRHAAVLPPPQRHAASLWWSGQVGQLGGAWPAGGHGSALVHVMYLTLAELVGPVRADRCFTLAVAQLEASGDVALAEIRRYL